MPPPTSSLMAVHVLLCLGSKVVATDRSARDKPIVATTAGTGPLDTRNYTDATEAIAGTARNQEDFSDSIQIKILDSCADRCYDGVWLPCSCTEGCAVFGNCCEDVEQYCPPDIYAGGGHAVVPGSRTECQPNGIYMVTTCPPDQGGDRAVSQAPQAIQQAIDAVSRGQGSPLDAHLANTPVTDTNSLWTFANYTVFRCAATPSAVAVCWSLFFKNKRDFNFDNLDSEGSGQVGYIPPPEMARGIVYPCEYTAVDTCPTDTEHSQRARCQNGTVSLVKHKYLNTKTIVYKNVHCAQCHFDRPVNLSPFVRWVFDHVVKKVELGVIFTINANDISLEAVSPGNTTQWQTAQCSKADGLNLKCTTTNCHSDARLVKNCRLAHRVTLVLTDSTLENILPSAFMPLAKCFLNRVLDFQVSHWEEPSPGKLVWFKKDLYASSNVALEAFFSTTLSVIPGEFSDMMPAYLQAMGMLGKLFAFYTHAYRRCRQREWPVGRPASVPASASESQQNQNLFTMYQGGQSKMAKEWDGAPVYRGLDSPATTTMADVNLKCEDLFELEGDLGVTSSLDEMAEGLEVPLQSRASVICMCSVAVTVSLDCASACWETPRYEGDEAILHRVLTDTCVAHTMLVLSAASQSTGLGTTAVLLAAWWALGSLLW